MSAWTKLVGTTLSYFRIGLTGPRLKNDSGALRVRNAADSTDADFVCGAATFTGPINTARGTIAMHATTMDLWAQPNLIDATGSALPITAIANAPQAGAVRTLFPPAGTVIADNAMFDVEGGGNYTTVAGDGLVFQATAVNAYDVWVLKAAGVGTSKVNNFRLSLTSATPVTTADVTAATTIYCVPYTGNQISLYNGSTWVTRASAEFSLALGTLTSGKPHDVFCYDNAGTPTLEFLVWTNDTTRATALAYQDGVLCKTGALTRRYLGTFYTTSTTTTEDSAANRYLWNFYNRVRRSGRVIETTASWTYSTGSYRQTNGSTSNQVNFVVGVSEDCVTAIAQTYAQSSGATLRGVKCGIGLDSTTTLATGATYGNAAINNGVTPYIFSRYNGIPPAGKHYIASLEFGGGADTQTWYGTTGATGLTMEVMA